MPDWFAPALAVLPTVLGVFLAVGVPWALVCLPRHDWRDRPLVLALALALGPTLLTTAMFLLGTFARITPAGTLLAAALLALWGGVIAWTKGSDRRQEAGDSHLTLASLPLASWEKLILAALVIAALGRIVHAAFWPFTAYDVLWVYGYNARVFTLTGQIPASMGYYPQMIPLSYTFAQLAWGGVNDHAARMAMLPFAWGSILAAYLLGARLWDRRVGLLTAALWTFYPHHGQWAQFGDLEVPLTFFFTLAALFFMLAWRSLAPSAHRGGWPVALTYAVVSGLMLGGALWIKPTAGALVWGIGLVVGIEAVRLRFDWARLWPKVRLAILTGLAAAPIGGMWYVRNLLLGHPAVEFPPAYWLTQAQRSGQELGWPLLILALLALRLLLEPPERRPDWRLLFPGTALLILGALPSAGVWVGTRTHRLTAEEVAVMLLGALLYAAAFSNRQVAKTAKLPGLLLANSASWRLDGAVWLIAALVLPYFVTWFWSYSYHPRLAFAITPLQLVLVAALIARIGARLAEYVRPRRRQAMAATALLCWIVPGMWLTFQSTIVNGLANDLPTDDAKQLNGNQALFETVIALRQAEEQGPINVLAPGALRLPFFFPLAPINTAPVTDLALLDDRVTHYVAGGENDGVYRALGQTVNPVRALTGLDYLAHSVRISGDQDFWYELFAVNTALRHVRPDCNPLPQPVIYPGFAEVIGYGIGGNTFWPGRRVVLTLCWRVLEPTARDYTVYLHVVGPDRAEPYATWDHIPGQGQYPTYLWEAGTYVVDRLTVSLDPAVVPLGDYQVHMGLYELATGQRASALVEGEAADGFVLLDRITLLAEEPQ